VSFSLPCAIVRPLLIQPNTGSPKAGDEAPNGSGRRSRPHSELVSRIVKMRLRDLRTVARGKSEVEARMLVAAYSSQRETRSEREPGYRIQQRMCHTSIDSNRWRHPCWSAMEQVRARGVRVLTGTPSGCLEIGMLEAARSLQVPGDLASAAVI
jgi:hypothetical protein